MTFRPTSVEGKKWSVNLKKKAFPKSTQLKKGYFTNPTFLVPFQLVWVTKVPKLSLLSEKQENAVKLCTFDMFQACGKFLSQNVSVIVKLNVSAFQWYTCATMIQVIFYIKAISITEQVSKLFFVLRSLCNACWVTGVPPLVCLVQSGKFKSDLLMFGHFNYVNITLVNSFDHNSKGKLLKNNKL